MSDTERRPRWNMTVVLASTAAVFLIAAAATWRVRGMAWDAGILVSAGVLALLWFIVAVLPILLRRLN